jgi:ubiquinone/menaquinone biosynthesis C-methylase UbiE
VEGIPIIKKGIIGTDGQTIDEVKTLIASGNFRDALLAMIMPPPPDLARWFNRLPNVTGIYRLKRLINEPRNRKWCEEAGTWLLDSSDRQSARQLFDFYYHRTGIKMGDEYNAWTHRVSQPRYLGALSFANLIFSPKKPVLDLACGYGYITRYLRSRANGQTVIGADRNFFSLYVAKHWFSPEARYVCCDADAALPFPDDAFSAVLCADAFHYFANKLPCVRELMRLTCSDGIIFLLSVLNSLVKRPGFPRRPPPEGYEALVKDVPHRLVSERAVMERYVEKKGPPLARSMEMTAPLEDMWFSIVASRQQDVFKDHGPLTNWPHAYGKLELNPLYVPEGSGSDGVTRFRRRYPSSWYEMENSGFKHERYLPEDVTINDTVLTDLKQGYRTPAVDRLIEQCVVLGVPERY